MTKTTVMIVEDEALIGEDMARTLRRGGYDVLGPHVSEEAAMRQLGAVRPDVALLDVNLGGGRDSYEIAAALEARQTPFVFLTGYAAMRSERFSQTRRLSKPCMPDELLGAVEELTRTDQATMSPAASQA